MKDEIKIRKSWPNKGDFDPATKIEKPKIDYKRSDKKQAIQDALDQEAADNAGSDLDWLP
jgi:hypothetical protein